MENDNGISSHGNLERTDGKIGAPDSKKPARAALRLEIFYSFPLQARRRTVQDHVPKQMAIVRACRLSARRRIIIIIIVIKGFVGETTTGINATLVTMIHGNTEQASPARRS